MYSRSLAGVSGHPYRAEAGTGAMPSDRDGQAALCSGDSDWTVLPS